MLSLPRTLSATVVAVTVAAGTAFVTPTAHAASASNYAALGDSYSAGVGAGNYLPDSGACKRSANSYPALWNNSHPGGGFAFVACSGAKTADVRAGQLSVLNSATTLVTISIGGNDAGFVDTVKSCVLGSENDCSVAVDKAKTYATTKLPADLDATYAQIRNRAPNARLVVLGYPRLFELGGCFLGMSTYKRTILNQAADTLADITRGRAGAANADYADVRNRFAGHGVCGSNPWINGIKLPIDESYHPNGAGQSQGYLPALQATVGATVGARP
ncbi:SGNH/GDSL hydrolase family protein [Embleya sp. NPDC127516]|uniref:SGNH/GDSL hydrolase family protein n=1 Tax=Embleya sp. NPDC127516 TaxID=3363990 RepID=UPI0038065518